MVRSTLVRATALFVLCAVLAAPLAAAGLRSASPTTWIRSTSGDFLGWFWSTLTTFWSPEGCQLDPNGRCPMVPAGYTKAGCHIDPFGRCLIVPSSQIEGGCQVDPFGRCTIVPSSQDENGCGLDPFGRCGS